MTPDLPNLALGTLQAQFAVLQWAAPVCISLAAAVIAPAVAGVLRLIVQAQRGPSVAP
jgi:hypothetical protein